MRTERRRTFKRINWVLYSLARWLTAQGFFRFRRRLPRRGLLWSRSNVCPAMFFFFLCLCYCPPFTTVPLWTHHTLRCLSFVYISEPRCGPLAGGSGSPIACALTSSGDVNDAPQFLPLVDRRPSVSMLLKWGDRSTPTAARQGLSFLWFVFCTTRKCPALSLSISQCPPSLHRLLLIIVICFLIISWCMWVCLLLLIPSHHFSVLRGNVRKYIQLYMYVQMTN